MAHYQYVQATVSDRVGTLTLDRPERLNAFDADMAAEMVTAARELVEDPTVRVLVVAGNGRAFCAGADLGHLGAAVQERRYDDAMAVVLRGGELVRVLHEAPQPVLGSLNGAAAGGGANLALACDLRIASDRASIGQVFHRIGLHPDMGGTYFLPRVVGTSRALELIWSTEMLTAKQCFEFGLVNRIVPHERLAEETAAWGAPRAAQPPKTAPPPHGGL